MATPKLAPKPQAKPDWTHTCADNVAVEVNGDVLTVRVDLRKNLGLSSSGKTLVVGTTGGFLGIPTHDGVTLALNVNRKNPDAPARSRRGWREM